MPIKKKDSTTFFSFFLAKNLEKSSENQKKKKKRKKKKRTKHWNIEFHWSAQGYPTFGIEFLPFPLPPPLTRLQIRDFHHPLTENANRTATNACLSNAKTTRFVRVEIETRDQRQARAIVTSHTLLEYASNGPAKAWNNIAIIILLSSLEIHYNGCDECLQRRSENI